MHTSNQDSGRRHQKGEEDENTMGVNRTGTRISRMEISVHCLEIKINFCSTAGEWGRAALTSDAENRAHEMLQQSECLFEICHAALVIGFFTK